MDGCFTGHVTWRLVEATADDVPGIVAVFQASRADALPWLPVLHDHEEDLAFFAGLVARARTWIAVDDGGTVLGMAIVGDGLLAHLYVAPASQGLGIGTALLDRAKEEAGHGMRLWTFQRNERARSFYASRGLVEEELTDGAGNEERMPDVLLRWP